MPARLQAEDLSAAELGLRLRQQELVAAFSCFALESDDLQAILDEASRTAANGLQVRLAKVLQFLPAEGEFLVRAGTGWKPGVVGHARIGGDKESPAGYAFCTGEPVLANDLGSEPRFRTPQLLRDHGVKSAINVLVTDDQRFGVLEVDSTNRDEFSTSDLAFLQALANTLSAAIRAREREDAKSAMLREKEALLLENQRLLVDKDLLAREIHHRVTNSLQLVHGALTLQLRALRDPRARGPIEDAAARVLAIAAVHRRLYRGGSPVAADASQYLQGLLDDLKLLLPSSGERRLVLETEALTLSADDLTHLGLIVVELVTNAMKHGRGNVTVSVVREPTALAIAVSDEGAGFPARFDAAESAGLGLKIVSSMAGHDQEPAILVDRSVPFSRIVARMAVKAAGG
jgi:two-component sensor histidine kinase